MPELKSLDNGSVYIYQGGSSFETLDLPEFVDETFYLYTESNGLTDAGIQTESFYYFGSSAQYYEVLTEGEGVYYFDGSDYLSNKYLESYHTYYYNGGSEFSDMGEMDPGIYSIYDHYASELDLDESKLYRPFIGSGPTELREEEWYNDMLELEVGGSVSFTVEDSLGNQYSFTATRTA